jgi:hypothetical protein
MKNRSEGGDSLWRVGGEKGIMIGYIGDVREILENDYFTLNSMKNIVTVPNNKNRL